MSDLHALCRFAPPAWEQIPDLGLYMDQVITFIGRVYAPVYGADVKRCLTPAMINNYVKAKLLPRPAGKKYSREQLALLTMIVALKQTSSIEDIRRMLQPREDLSTEALYAAFCRRFPQALSELSADPAEALSPALDFAIRAAVFQAACAAALDREEDTSVIRRAQGTGIAASARPSPQ